jgi:hypothetical protein
MVETLLTSLALIAVPIGLGSVVGSAVCRVRGRRLGGALAVIGCVLVPAAAVVGLGIRFPIIGLWDAGFEGLLFGAGVLWAVHRALQDGRTLALLATSMGVSLVLIEVLSRVFLPAPPGFPTRGGPHLLLAEALRGDVTHQPWDTLSKDLVCSIVYGDQYSPIFDLSSAEQSIVTPRNFTARPDARRRVLHLGDSMAFGFGLERSETFTADLERLQPGVQHINASIPGTAPDAYLGILQSWIAAHRIDLVVMHVYEGNDLDGLDSRYPCCDWKSLLVYEGGDADLRCATATAPNLGHAGLPWLRFHNPPPYLVRALLGTSTAAAHLAAAMAREPYFLVDQPLETRVAHLEAILRSAGALLAARQIPFIVDVLPTRTWLETLATWQHYAPNIVEAARRAGVPVVDESDFFRDAVRRGERLFFDHPQDIHFNAHAHALWAAWLRDRLATDDQR